MSVSVKVPEQLDPKLWGRNTWEFLEMIVLTYPENNPSDEKRDAVYNLLESLGSLLPCDNCKKHYRDFFESVSMATVLSGRAYLFQFYFDLRKDVAERSGESFRSITKDEAWKRILQKFHLYVPNKADNLRARMTPLLISNPTVSSSRRANERNKIVLNTSSGCACGK